jgi:hypothetical protein
VEALGRRLVELLPAQLGAPHAVARLVEAGTGLTLVQGLLALLPMSLYGEGLRRALLRFTGHREGVSGWRGRLTALPVLLITPVLLYPLLLTVPAMADLAETGGAGPTLGRIAIGFYGSWRPSSCHSSGASGSSVRHGCGGRRSSAGPRSPRLLLHLVVLVGWLFTQALDEVLERRRRG